MTSPRCPTCVPTEGLPSDRRPRVLLGRPGSPGVFTALWRGQPPPRQGAAWGPPGRAPPRPPAGAPPRRVALVQPVLTRHPPEDSAQPLSPLPAISGPALSRERELSPPQTPLWRGQVQATLMCPGARAGRLSSVSRRLSHLAFEARCVLLQMFL